VLFAKTPRFWLEAAPPSLMSLDNYEDYVSKNHSRTSRWARDGGGKVDWAPSLKMPRILSCGLDSQSGSQAHTTMRPSRSDRLLLSLISRLSSCHTTSFDARWLWAFLRCRLLLNYYTCRSLLATSSSGDTSHASMRRSC